MVEVEVCDEMTIRRIAVAIKKAALGKRVSFSFENGTHRYADGGHIASVPNGGLTFRLDIDGGAVDTGIPAPKPGLLQRLVGGGS